MKKLTPPKERVLTADERAALTNALRVAAERYLENAKLAFEPLMPGERQQLAKQFEQQAVEVRELAVKLEKTAKIMLFRRLGITCELNSLDFYLTQSLA